MDVILVFKVAAIGIGVAVIHQVLAKSGREDYAMLTTLSGILVVVMMLLPHLSDLLAELKELMDF